MLSIGDMFFIFFDGWFIFILSGDNQYLENIFFFVLAWTDKIKTSLDFAQNLQINRKWDLFSSDVNIIE